MNTEKYAQNLINILLLYSIIIAAICLSFDVFNTLKYGGIDLRNRVVAARVTLDDRDPYFTKWRVNSPPYFVDGRDYFKTLPVSRYTGTPSLLLLHFPFASLDYKIQQIIWLAIQEILLLLSIFFLAKLSKNKYKLILILGFMFIFGSYFWRFHVGNGQIYILFTFAMILSYFLFKKGKEILAGFILGLTAIWRPPFIIMGLPFLIFGKRKIIFGGFFGLFTGVISSFLFMDFQIWESYFLAMKIHGLHHINLIEARFGFIPFFNNIEGVQNTFFSADLPAIDSSLRKMIYRYFDIRLGGELFWIALILVSYFFGLYLWKKKKFILSSNKIFFIAFSLLFISEFLLPASRLSYNNVIWLPILSLLLIEKDWKHFLHFDLVLLIAGLLFNYLYRVNFYLILIADYCILFFVVWEIFRLLKRKQVQST